MCCALVCIVWNYKEGHYMELALSSIDAGKENMTYENLAPKTIKVFDGLQHMHAVSQTRGSIASTVT